MVIRKATCLLLALVFLLTIPVPGALADGDPPYGGGDIHPWDNNDGHRIATGEPLTAIRLPVIIVWYGFGGWQLAVYQAPATTSARTTMEERSSSTRTQNRVTTTYTRGAYR